MRKIASLVLMVTLLLVAQYLNVSAAPSYKMPIRVLDKDGDALASATVTVWFVNGTKVGSGTTNSTGWAVINIKGAGDFVIFVEKGYDALTRVEFDPKEDENVIMDLKNYHWVNITAVYNVSYIGRPTIIVKYGIPNVKLWLTAKTNRSVLVDDGLPILFNYPASVPAFPYRYNLTLLTANEKEIENNKTIISIKDDYEIVGFYSQEFYLSLETWAIIGMVVIIIIAVALVAVTGRKTVKAIIDEAVDNSRKFVKRKKTFITER